jgi:uncharacterized protein YjbI with pentapeptide repeats
VARGLKLNSPWHKILSWLTPKTKEDQPPLSDADIRPTAYQISKQRPWQTDAENWHAAQHILKKKSLLRFLIYFNGDKERSGWDWADLLLKASVPVIVAVGGWIYASHSLHQQQTANRQVQRDLVVSEYVKNMQSLILEKNLHGARIGSPVSAIARSLTITSLSRLWRQYGEDLPLQQGQILRFIHEARLINVESPNLSLYEAGFSFSDLRNLYLFKADLSFTDFTGSDLSGSNLAGSNLTNAYLLDSNLSMANLMGANLVGAKLSNANLNRAMLNGANLSFANLSGADLRGADMSGKILSREEEEMADKIRLGKKTLRDLNPAKHINLIKSIFAGNHLVITGKGYLPMPSANLSGSHLSNVKWDASTKWPEPKRLEGAIDIPADLRKQLGI